ncbi:hypothetical protein CERSUDRAFT_124679 [Gelatoporia subvermispora B]|uniref:Uncharacterized protein n=1 Tax=Ceriporiopsis subvermispora (strain B) TaxID=914234 RepID=M2QE61_CERS8|nr:hypothetical protein CERSUDRAFT_124679 [Gelatoporia subvermispora B]
MDVQSRPVMFALIRMYDFAEQAVEGITLSMDFDVSMSEPAITEFALHEPPELPNARAQAPGNDDGYPAEASSEAIAQHGQTLVSATCFITKLDTRATVTIAIGVWVPTPAFIIRASCPAIVSPHLITTNASVDVKDEPTEPTVEPGVESDDEDAEKTYLSTKSEASARTVPSSTTSTTASADATALGRFVRAPIASQAPVTTATDDDSS